MPRSNTSQSIDSAEDEQPKKRPFNRDTLVKLMVHGERTNSPVAVTIGTGFNPVRLKAPTKGRGSNPEKEFIEIDRLGPYSPGGHPTVIDTFGKHVFMRKEIDVTVRFLGKQSYAAGIPKIPIHLFSYRAHKEPDRLPARTISQDRARWISLWRVFAGFEKTTTTTIKPTIEAIKARCGNRDQEDPTVRATKTRANQAKDFIGFTDAAEWLHQIGHLLAPADFVTISAENLKLGSKAANRHMLSMEAMVVEMVFDNEDIEYSVTFTVEPDKPWALVDVECKILLVKEQVELSYRVDGFTTRTPSQNDFRAIHEALRYIIASAKAGTLQDELRQGLVRDLKRDIQVHGAKEVARITKANEYESRIILALQEYIEESKLEDGRQVSLWDPRTWYLVRRNVEIAAKRRKAAEDTIQTLSHHLFDHKYYESRENTIKDPHLQKLFNSYKDIERLRLISKELDELLAQGSQINRPDWWIPQWRMSGQLEKRITVLKQSIDEYVQEIQYDIAKLRCSM